MADFDRQALNDAVAATMLVPIDGGEQTNVT